ncbi:AGE family epimerase/isomerase [Aquabacterium sp. A7-Y]|uniref:AGE family epimerase/isomerase n=1 Tax=Aquabacterium sp. A7-Y TaxID=1349605 RepID=UPI00223E6037|nr:AGE family epimerase/isomerase [Aquabacterium sp. A7-Y]MCW7540825.1 AGE family epimerase/isomerase [Aquabacterium sp. A7-Y]
MPPALPDFHRRQTVLDHVHDILAFYHPRALDPSGGFFHFFKDDGTVYDAHTRHLVSSTRFVFLWAMASRHFDEPAYRRHMEHAVRFLREAHRNRETGGYAWQLRWQDGRAEVSDATNHCYGLAFVLLAYAHAVQAGMAEAKAWLDETWELLEQRFWEPAQQLYADEATPGWQLRPYRGQNANMHATEALLAAYEATGEVRYLDRAASVAESIVQRQAGKTGGLVWEHYREDWSPDWDYNRHDRSNIFRPWGFQPGHLTEWAKLLLILERHRPLPWLLPRAESLFEAGLRHAWDDTHGGIVYGFAPDFTVCDDDKYHWVQAESLAAAAVLGARTGKAPYWDWYDRLWAYCWRHWVDHEHGAWFRILTREHRKLTDAKSPAGKVDYHTTGACYEILRALKG